MVSWSSVDGEVPYNEPFSVELELKTLSELAMTQAEVDFDCRMPDHGHGMTVKTKVQPAGEGRFRVEGVLLHMRGRWVMSVDIRLDGITDKATFEVNLI